MELLQYLINGISIGSVYAIIALGYTMVYGIAKMLNFAHGDVIMVGAYMSFCVTNYLGLPAVVSVVAAMAVMPRPNRQVVRVTATSNMLNNLCFILCPPLGKMKGVFCP